MYFVVIFCHNFINCVLSWGVGVGQELSGTGGCIVYMHIAHWKGESEGEIGSPGLNFPVPEGSGVLNSKRKRVQKVSRCTGARGSTFTTWFVVSGSGGFRLINRSVQRIRCRARGNRFTWFVLSGTGGFRLINYSKNPVQSEGKQVHLVRTIRYRRIQV